MRSSSIRCFLLVSQLVPLQVLLAQTAPPTITNLDKNVVLRFSLVNDQVRYTVLYKSKTVIEP